MTKEAGVPAFNRPIHLIDAGLHFAQHAYRRSRGTATHLAALHGATKETLKRSEYGYDAILDISSAFETAPHQLSPDAFQATDVDKFCVKFAEHWPRVRTLRVHIMTEDGQLLSRPKNIKGTCPQGGILSPMLWNLFFKKYVMQY